MAFGKKKTKKQENTTGKRKYTPAKVDLSNNPLYPPKKENEVIETLKALGTSAVCLVLAVGVVAFAGGGRYANAYDGGSGTAPTVSDTDMTEEQTGEFEDDTQSEEPQEEPDDSQYNQAADEDMDEEEEVEEEQDFIIADSNSRYISSGDLEGLSKEELSYARNEIYARHGRRFKDEEIQSYFDSKSWYSGTIAPDDFTENMLNEYEKKNAETILAYEKSKGYK